MCGKQYVTEYFGIYDKLSRDTDSRKLRFLVSGKIGYELYVHVLKSLKIHSEQKPFTSKIPDNY